ncbi:hypothetical protein M7775_15420 [Sporomusa sphaeroides DSM 2875]|uniref:hypothetical protein n=1 Tax=Sporomusa sphaeroides TaxID=47679 RepID=UPI0020308E69|nr:hypothetical protein [Sporomusa sphaeroides]MCM0759947.1 hypothetical protein [Sporomusa sphaeroides DSM 2875]
MSEKNDLEILIPDSEIKLASGETIVIKPFSFAKLPKVVALINSIGVGIFALLEAGNGIQVEAGEQADGTATLEIDDLVVNKVNDFVETHFEEVVEVLAIYCRRPKEFFLDEDKGPDIEEACQIICTIIARHLDFFTKTLRPIVAGIRSKAEK